MPATESAEIASRASTTLAESTPKVAHAGSRDIGAPKADVAMDDLAKAMGGLESSLSFLPRGVRKAKGAAAATKTSDKAGDVAIDME